MKHAAMDHGHMGPGGAMCSMNMLFTWDATDLCIVFRQWHVGSTAALVVSLAAVVALAMGYEALRAVSRRFEAVQDCRVAALPRQQQPKASHRAHVVKAVLYAAQTFYAFMLMLVFMTYNGWVMMALTLGAFLGYLVFGRTTSATRDGACH